MNHKSTGERIGGFLEEVLRKYLADLLNLLALTAMAVAPLGKHILFAIFFIVLSVLLGISSFVVRRKTDFTYQRMRNQRDKAYEARDLAIRQRRYAEVSIRRRHKALLNTVDILANHLADHLELNESHQRLSIYYHENDQFKIVARIASNPNLRSAGRKSYPQGQGVIGTVWREGDAKEGIGKGEQWETWMKRFDFSDEELSKMRMKSIILAAVRLDFNRENIGIVLIESEKPRGITAEHFSKLQESLLTKALAEILVLIRSQSTPA